MRTLLFTICVVFCVFVNRAVDLNINRQLSIPSEGGKYASLTKLDLEFDLSSLDLGDYTPSEVGIQASMSSKRLLTIYKGLPTDNEILTTIRQNITPTSDNFQVGSSISFSLDKEYVLEPNQLYTLSIAANSLLLVPANGEVNMLAQVPLTTISFYGKDTKDGELVCTDFLPNPSSPIKNLDYLSLTFNSEIDVITEAKADLYEDDVLMKSVPLTVSKEDNKTVLADFSNVELYTSHTYLVRISENLIFAKGTTTGYREIELNYDGAAYKYLSYGRISPKQGDVNYLATVSVPVSCEDGYNLGRAKAPTAYLYKDDEEEPLQTVKCTLGLDGKSWLIPFYNFSLEPNTTYKVVMPAEQFSIWKILESGGYNEVKDTTNPELNLSYTTSNNIELPSPIEFGTIEPSKSVLKKLDNIKFNLNRYEFEDVTYYPIFATSSLVEGWNEIYLYEDDTTEPIANIAMDLKWDSSNNYWLEPINTPSINLYSGKNYKLIVPKGFIICSNRDLAEISANEELVVNLTGTAKDEYDVTFILAEVGSMKSVVAAGKTLSVDLAGTEDWKVSAVLFNGEAVETAGDTYTTPAIEDDATIEVEYEYAREIDYNFTVGVDMTEICPYGVVSEGENLIISGVQLGDAISIYTTGGLKVADLPTVPQNMDRVAVSLPTDQAYIILINGKSLKFLHR